MLYLVSIGAIAVGTLALLLGRQLYYKTNLDTLSDVLKGCGAHLNSFRSLLTMNY